MNDCMLIQRFFPLERLGADGAEVGRLAGVLALMDLGRGSKNLMLFHHYFSEFVLLPFPCKGVWKYE